MVAAGSGSEGSNEVLYRGNTVIFLTMVEGSRCVGENGKIKTVKSLRHGASYNVKSHPNYL